MITSILLEPKYTKRTKIIRKMTFSLRFILYQGEGIPNLPIGNYILIWFMSLFLKGSFVFKFL